MDKSAITRAVTVAGGRFAPGHLGELTQQVPFEMVDEVLKQTCRVQRRVRGLPARVVVNLLLAGCLFAELGYAQVWRRLAAGLGGLPVAAPTASAMTQARRRLGAAPLRELFFLLRNPSPQAARWKGLLVCAVDGTSWPLPTGPGVRQHLRRHPVAAHRRRERLADRPPRRHHHHGTDDDKPGVVVDPGDQLGRPPAGQRDPADIVELPQLHRRVPLPPPAGPPVLLLLRSDQPVADHHPVHRGTAGRRACSALAELESDPARSPPRMLPAQPADQRLDLGVHP
jgi:Insertion element 4 transposase N-terminal